MNDFIRINHAAILSLVGILVFLTIVWHFVKKFLIAELDTEAVQLGGRIFKTIVILIVIGFGWFLIAQASVNNTPRQVIDRSVLQEQTRDINHRSEVKR